MNEIGDTLLIVLLVSTFVGGLILGIFIQNLQKPELISARKDACEVKGGKYSYVYNDVSENGYYYETCEMVGKEIKDF